MRKSILACTVSFLMSPMASWALGMGDIQVNSSLNQPLKAEIALHSVTKKDLDTLRVALAPKSIYVRAGIERSAYLSQFRFELIERKGKHYVAITSKKPFKEPFANFLIEANWGSGRLLREYTILLDPPEFIRKHTVPVKTVSASKSSHVKRASSKSTPTKIKKKANNTVLTPSSKSTKNKTESSSNNGELSYGPTKSNDTLWVIAKDMAPANISVEQMMIALLRDNPDAFIDDNINNLKKGYVLRIKDPKTLGKLTRSMANSQVQEQYKSWQETRNQQTNANIVDRSVKPAQERNTDGELKLVTSGKSNSATSSKGDLSQISDLKEKLDLSNEEIESKALENQELRSRIVELEEMLETKTSLVELKDASLASLQKRLEDKEKQEALDSDTSSETTTTDSTDNMNTDSSDSMDNMNGTTDEVNDTSEDVTETVVQEEEVQEPEPVAQEEEVQEPEPVAQEPKVVEEAKKPTPAAKAEPKAEEGIVDVLLSDDVLPYAAGGGGLLIALLAFFGLRGRGKKEEEFEESILDSELVDAQDSEFSVDDSELVDAGNDSSTTETSFLSDFSADDMETLKPDDTEADPISEADVFMVYGRYQQAEELLQGVVKTSPDRVDYQMKLLEVYHGDNSKDSFAIQADVVKGVIRQTNEDYASTSEWTKARNWAEKLGVNIDMPDSFDENVAEVTTDFLENESLIEEDDLALDTEDMALNEDSLLDEETSEFSLDDIDDLSDELDATTDDTDDILELDESTLNLDDADDLNDSLDLDEASLKLDDNLDLEESLKLDDTSDLSLEDDSSELSLDADEGDTLQLDDVGEIEELDESTSDLDLLTSDMDLDDLDGDFPEMDAVDTKLDLAKAYIDMGDMESASSILNEVVDEGSDEQKSTAESLLKQTKA